MTRIGKLFENTRAQRHPALIAYITAGDPDPSRTVELVRALERGGAGLIELGVPFSDPIADGPVIQRAAERALKAGTTLRTVLEIASEIRRTSEIPLLLFTYMNPVVRYGFEKLAFDAARAGVDGCLLTDLSVEEAGAYVQAMRGAGLDTVFLAAPTSTERRLQLVAKYSSGFVYLVSRTGVTGEQASLGESAAALAARARAVMDLPLAVGFGISTPEHVAQVAAFADGVVVGSALVRTVEQHSSDPELPSRLEAFTRELAGGLARKAHS
jgi:tryptophan synthase alpha chain